MHCPNCGSGASEDQRFCRSCGLGLEEFSRLLTEKLVAENLTAAPRADAARNRALKRLGISLWIGAATILVGGIFWAIISEIIIGKGEVVSGVLFLLFITALVLGGLLVSYSSSRERPNSTDGQESKGAKTAPGLASGAAHSLHMSVTERTTELIERENKNSVPTRNKDSSA
jgi:hypothetical protein